MALTHSQPLVADINVGSIEVWLEGPAGEKATAVTNAEAYSDPNITVEVLSTDPHAPLHLKCTSTHAQNKFEEATMALNSCIIL